MMTASYRRFDKEVTFRIIDGEGFAITDKRIHHLNAAATLIWTAIETPATAQDIAALLGEIFPDVPEARLMTDVEATLNRLVKDGLAGRIKT